MPASTVTSKGQITLPVEIRRALRLKAGDRVSFRTAKDGAVIIEPDTVDLMSLAGSLRSRVGRVTIEQMNEAIRKGSTRR